MSSRSFLLTGPLACALVGALLVAAGCGESSAASAFGADEPAAPGDNVGDGVGAGGSSSFADDASSPKALYRGNPLCRIDDTTCSPDDDGVHSTRGLTNHCATPPPDGGAEDPSSVKGCRISRSDTGESVGPKCDHATRAGTDGEACTTGDECAPGFDCIEGPKGATCRRYCCMGTCDGNTSQNGGDTFCDVQKLVDANHMAPVCMPVKQCKLLMAGECAEGETCAVVTDSGDTGCVAVGDAQVGQSCDAAHCAVGLTCLGQPGNRKCYQLCKVGSPCGPSQTCQTSTVFKDPTYGVCQGT